MTEPQLEDAGFDFESKTLVFDVPIVDHTLLTCLQLLGVVCIVLSADATWSSGRNLHPLPDFDILIKNPAPPASGRLKSAALRPENVS
jgi:hypothetical protein